MKMDRIIWIVLIFAALATSPGSGLGSVLLDEEEVIFRLDLSYGREVYLVGDFNGWNPTLDRLVEREGVLEIRLFLVPGKYRYMFSVDGDIMADPGNSYRDEDGRSYFIFREAGDDFEIVFEGGVDREEDAELEVSEISLSGNFYSGPSKTELLAMTGLHGRVDDMFSGGFLAAFDYYGDGADSTDLYLLRADAMFESDRGSIYAFSHTGDLSFGDPLSIFGDVGPYRYPLGLFCRGVDISGDLAFGIRGRIFYADRIGGYKGEVRSIPSASFIAGSSSLPFFGRDNHDSDMTGIKAGYIDRGFEIDYLFRHDIGPDDLNWTDSDDPSGIFKGYEKLYINGLLVRYSAPWNISLVGEYLRGKTFLDAESREEAGGGSEEYDYLQDWEEGHRLYFSLNNRFERMEFDLSWAETVIGGDPAMRSLRTSDWEKVAEMSVSFDGEYFTGRICGRDRSFSAEDSPTVLYLQKYNFWLDGDQVDTAIMPFLDSRGIYDISLTLEEKGDSLLPSPFPLNGFIRAEFRKDKYVSNLKRTEIVVGKGIPLNDRFSFHFDLRSVHYIDRRWKGKKSFFNSWFGFSGSFPKSSYAFIGVGVSPYRFDSFSREMTPYGREKYFLEHIVANSYDLQEEDQMIDRLIDAEDSLADEWTISFQAGMDF